ncbi:MAG: rhomboid family intramembrane serine protease [Chloroflexota bacterium]
MIPLSDSVGAGRRPVATVALIVVCGLVFGYELALQGAELDVFVQRWGAVPRLVLAALGGDPRVPRQDLLSLFTSQFLHAGFLHLGGNMLFLWVFGRAVEDRVGPSVFLVVYLLAGAMAGLAQCLISTGNNAPLIGASGSIAVVLGLYFIWYPSAWVRVLMPVLFFFWTFDLPAVLVLALWFGSQFFNGITAITHTSQASGGVAVWAHVAGFVLGAASARFLPRTHQMPRPGVGPPRLSPANNAPGPARLVWSLANLAALLLAARLLLRFFGQLPARPPLAAFSVPVVAVTQPVVAPLQELLPTVRILGGVLETYTLAAILAIYVLAGVVRQVFMRNHPNRP